jgi:predicted N-acetyltransferase YhbS
VELIDLPNFGPDAYAQIVDGEPDPFGTDQLAIEWGPKSDHVGLTDEGRLIGHAGWVAADVRVATGETIGVLGLGSVLLHRLYRGAGVGSTLVSGAIERMRMRGATMAMLFCRPERLRFYGDLGWYPIDGVVTVGQPGQPIVMPLRTCWLPLAEGATIPPGDLEFPGLPF